MLGGRWLAFKVWMVEHCDCNCVPPDCPARCLLSVGRSGNYIRCYFCGNLNIGRICHVGCKIEIWRCTCVRVANLCNLTNFASCRRLVSSTQLAENVSVLNLWPRNNQPDKLLSPFFFAWHHCKKSNLKFSKVNQALFWSPPVRPHYRS